MPLRNALHRRNHKERGQLAHRTRFGILEKHKDYVLRARDYHSKQDRLKRLREKAAERNQDEFYFGMVHQRTRDGVHIHDRGNQVLPVDIAKVLKTQDGNYIRTMRMSGQKKIDRLKEELGVLTDLSAPQRADQKDDGDEWEDEGLSEGEMETLKKAGLLAEQKETARSRKRKRKGRPAHPKHILFAESAEEARSLATGPGPVIPSQHKSPDNLEENDDLGWIDMDAALPRKRKRPADNDSMITDTGEQNEKARRVAAKKHRSKLLKELAARLSRDTSLKYAERELEMQRLLMGKGAAKRIKGIEKVENDHEDDDSDEDVLVPTSKPKRAKVADETTWRPRVYKWKAERKK